MNNPAQFCIMNHQNLHLNKIKSIKYALLIGALLGAAVLALQYFKLLQPDLELIGAPLLVLFFLAFGENLLALLLMYTMKLFSKLIK